MLKKRQKFILKQIIIIRIKTIKIFPKNIVEIKSKRKLSRIKTKKLNKVKSPKLLKIGLKKNNTLKTNTNKNKIGFIKSRILRKNK